MKADDQTAGAPLPLVIQLGFAGSRRLVSAEALGGGELKEFEGRVDGWLAGRLEKLRGELGMEGRHFFCGISSLAVGGDTIFSRACRANGMWHRVLLPQTREEFLNAEGMAGADFSTKEKEEARALLGSPHVIQERLVSDADGREERFEDVNREITRVSDLLICLVRAGSRGGIGGTEDLITRAVRRGKPVLVVHVDAVNGAPVFKEEWKFPGGTGGAAPALELPRVPGTLAGVRLADKAGGDSLARQYVEAVKGVCSDASAAMRRRFTLLAVVILGAHIVATVLASLALGFGPLHWHVVPVLLGVELVMLAVGMVAHWALHRSRTARRWAEARLLAEVTRSVQAVGSLHVYLRHFFSLPFPQEVRPVLRTLNVLHLQATRHDRTPWEVKRDEYVRRRLMAEELGQIDFYGRRVRVSRKRLAWLGVLFYVFWVTAFVSTSLKFAGHLGHGEEMSESTTAVLGTLAIVMPVLAAAALSLAAAHDLEAQEHTYHEMQEFLERQKKYLMTAASERDYADLVMETESRLLGETANWFSRRSFTGVA